MSIDRDLDRIISKINTYEFISRQLEPDQHGRKILQDEVIHLTESFLQGLPNRKAYQAIPSMGLGMRDLSIDSEPKSIETLSKHIQSHMIEPGLCPASGGHIAYIPGGGLYPAALGDYIADVTNEYAGVFYAGPGAVRMENMLLEWLCSLFSYPKGASGNLTSGGSMANLIAIVTARDARKISARKIPDQVIYMTRQTHHCVKKSINIAGLREANISYIDMDDAYRMSPTHLSTCIEVDIQKGLQPCMVIASAGTTDTGAVDPLNEISQICKKYNIWFHVDAAYGGFFIMAEETEHLFNGIDQADSIVVDPHKGLFLPYGSGAILVRNKSLLYQSHHMQASYLQDTESGSHEDSPADLSPELTKPFRGLRMWLPLQLFGTNAFKACLKEKIWLCRYFYEKVQEIGFEVGPYPALSVMLYRFIPKNKDANSFNLAIQEFVKNDGTVFISSTTIDSVVYLRLAVLSFRTRFSTIKKCLHSLEKAVHYLSYSE